jgi:hypothetical protein
MLQMLYNDSLEQSRSYFIVPDTIGVDDHYWTAAAHSETRGFAALNAGGSEQ